MKYEDMSYRALQEECKEMGLNAKGSKVELVDRLMGDVDEPDKPPLMFVFVGDKDKTINVTKYNKNGQPYLEPRTVKAQNPSQITLPANDKPGAQQYTFRIGQPTQVEDVKANRRLIERLRKGSHFKEIVADQKAA